MNTVYSFDVFDTCVSRRYDKPVDVFYELAKTVLGPNLYIENHDQVADLARLRIASEVNARNQHPDREDISLDAIYAQLGKVCPYSIDLEHMLATEIQIEKNCIFPNAVIKNYIDQLRNGGSEILFISDMYLPGEVIRDILLNTGIAIESDELYVSGSIGLRKKTGNLFRHVLQKKNLLPKQLCHIGDNFRSDYLVPRSLGIRAELRKPVARYYLDYHAGKQYHPVKSRITVSRLRGLHKETQLTIGRNDRPEKLIAPFATEIIAPLLVSYVAWVLRDAAAKNIKRLYFVARDGQILYQIAKRLKPEYAQIDLRYIYGSRHAWHIPTIRKVEANVPTWALAKNDSTSINAILARLGIGYEDISSILHESGFSSSHADEDLDQDDLDKLLQLTASDKVAALITTNASRLRSLAIAYFRQEGLFDQDDWALVDVGWHLSCQASLRKILVDEGFDRQVKGYYLGIRKNHLPENIAGQAYAFISERDGNAVTGEKYPAFFDQGTAAVIENVFMMADHPPVLRYQITDGVVSPVYAKMQTSELENDFMIRMREYIYSHIDGINGSDMMTAHADVYTDIALHNSNRFFSSPVRDYVNLIAQFVLSADQIHHINETRTIATGLTLSDLVDMGGHILRGRKGRYVDRLHGWYAGCAAISPFHIKYMFIGMMKTLKILNRFEEGFNNKGSIEK